MDKKIRKIETNFKNESECCTKNFYTNETKTKKNSKKKIFNYFSVKKM